MTTTSTARYAKLEAGKDFLAGKGALVQDLQTTAEEQADQFINTTFDLYDRSTWLNPGAVPPEVRTLALKWGSGEYRRLSFNAASPDASAPQYALDLKAEAEATAQKLLDRGYLISADGKRMYPAGGGASSSFFPTINCGPRVVLLLALLALGGCAAASSDLGGRVFG